MLLTLAGCLFTSWAVNGTDTHPCALLLNGCSLINYSDLLAAENGRQAMHGKQAGDSVMNIVVLYAQQESSSSCGSAPILCGDNHLY